MTSTRARWLTGLFWVAVLLAIAGCGGSSDGSSEGPPEPPSVPSVTAPPDTATANGSTTAPAPQGGFPTPEEQALLDTIPEATRSSCVRANEDDRGEDATVAVTCDLTATEGHIALYARFPDAQTMISEYRSIVSNVGATVDEGDCVTDPVAERSYGEGTGRVLCLADANDGAAAILWRHDDLVILAAARREDGNPGTLFDWWESPASGPVG